MPASIGYLVIDTPAPERLAAFWCRLLEVTVDTTIGDGQFVVLSPSKDGLTIGFQRVPDAKVGKNRLHIDLIVDDLDRATDEIETIGGRWLEPGTVRELEDFQSRLMGDLVWNEFGMDAVPTPATR